MIPVKLESRQRVFSAAAVAAVALTAAAYFLGLSPMLSAQAAKASRLEFLSQASTDAGKTARTLTALRAEEARLDDELAALPVKLEKASQVNARIQALVELFARSGLAIESQEQEPPVQRSRFATISLQFRVRGDFVQCVGVVQALAQMYRDQGVETLELSGNPSEPQRQVAMTLGLLWYVEPSEPRH